MQDFEWRLDFKVLVKFALHGAEQKGAYLAHFFSLDSRQLMLDHNWWYLLKPELFQLQELGEEGL